MKTRLFLLLFAALLAASCSVNKMAMRSSNPEFIGKYIPGVLEKNEKKLVKNPDDQALVLETGSLYIMYANAFVQGPAETLPTYEVEKKENAKVEAKKNYLRGVEIINTGLEKRFAGFTGVYKEGNAEKMEVVVADAAATDVELLYWGVAGTLCAYSLDPFDLGLGQKVGALKVMIDKAYALNPDYSNGALDDFYVLFYASLPESFGGDKTKVDGHFKLAVEKSKGLLAGPYISYAQSVAIPNQNYPAFKENLEKALAIDPNKDKDNRLVNTINQRKAQWLLDHTGDFFVNLDGDDAFSEDEPSALE
jgi:predicted anti-sigma-YlaC factor YlaD